MRGPRSPFTLCLLSAFLLEAACAGRLWGQAGKEGEPPALEEDLGSSGGLPGTLRLSDGKVIRGKVSFAEGARLRAYDARTRRPYPLELSRIAAIRTVVEHEAMEEAWTFEEEGFRRKVKLGWKYPLRNYGQELELKDGPVIVGHLYAATLYITDEAGEHRFKLPRQDKGRRGQTLADLVYVESLDLRPGTAPGTTARPAAARPPGPGTGFAALTGTISGLSAAAAVDRRALQGAPARISAGGGFRIEGLLPGPHALFLRRGNSITAGLEGKLSLSPGERVAVEARVKSIEEFFDQKRLVLLSGGRERLWALLELTRSGGTTLTDDQGRSSRFRRWELWVLRADGPRESDGSPWRIESRIFLDRLVVPATEAIPPCTYQVESRFWGVELRPGENGLPSL